MKNNSTFKSAISNLSFPENEKIWGKSIHDPILGLIMEDHPFFTEQDCIAVKELNEYRQKYISRYLSTEIGTLSDLEKSVINSLKEDKSIKSKNEIIKVQLPPKSATLSAIFWPKLLSSSSSSTILTIDLSSLREALDRK